LVERLFVRRNAASSFLNKDSEQRTDGKLVNLVPTGTAENGIEGYDIHFENIKMVPYKTEKLAKNGVAVISTSQPVE
jgi:hypothetical protein